MTKSCQFGLVNFVKKTKKSSFNSAIISFKKKLLALSLHLDIFQHTIT
ncbi:hypothetical protein FEM21_22730 [Flavobacterium seoulense]|uniref:Uncharacterized protein n=1 Tax=Flavobacterium seoulense TaxID=1492738 RepID=A0A066WV49_9FLAO|nr:hypothetical protein FEM21_22730 [Flavobacterium seoulense]